MNDTLSRTFSRAKRYATATTCERALKRANVPTHVLTLVVPVDDGWIALAVLNERTSFYAWALVDAGVCVTDGSAVQSVEAGR